MLEQWKRDFLVCGLMVFFVIPLMLVASHGVTDNEGAARALQSAGYSDVVVGGSAWLRCDKHDIYRTKFRATGPSGERVSGAVCAGWFKGSTIRLD